MNTKNVDVAIIGGGVLGVSLAYHLKNSGLSCSVFEKEASICRHASAKNAGMIRSLYRNSQLTEWALKSIANFPSEVKKHCFEKTGSIIFNRELPNHHHESFDQKSHNGIPFIFSEVDGLLDSETYVHSLKTLAQQDPNIQFLTKQKVRNISQPSDSWMLEVESLEGNHRTHVKADIVVNASGAWLNSALPKELQVPYQAFARHLFIAKGWDGTSAISNAPSHGFFWDEAYGWYMRKWDNQGSILVSACDTDPADPDNYSCNKDMSLTVSEKLLKSIPDIAANLSLGIGWHCFRTYTEDLVPIWGPDPRTDNLMWLGAFGGLGMSTSYAATKDLATYIRSGASVVEDSVKIDRLIHVENQRAKAA